VLSEASTLGEFAHDRQSGTAHAAYLCGSLWSWSRVYMQYDLFSYQSRRRAGSRIRTTLSAHGSDMR
jgi:hypothetical protein